MSIWLGQQKWIATMGIVAMSACLGCGGPTGPKRHAVTGTVTREGIDVDAGNIMFIPTEAKGVAASTMIKDGKYQFTILNGVPAGSYKVQIVQEPLRDPDYKGKKNEAPLLKDDRFKGKMPPNGWVKEADVADGQKDPIDFEISETDVGESKAGGSQRRGG